MRFHAVKCLGSVPILKSWNSFVLGAIQNLHLSARAIAQCRGAVSCSQTQAAVTSMAMTTCGDVSKHITGYFTIYNYCIFRGMNIHSPLIYGAHQGFWRVLRKFPSNHFPCIQQDFTGDNHLHDWCFQTAKLLWAKFFFFMTENSQQRLDFSIRSSKVTHFQLNLTAIFPAFSQPFQLQHQPSPAPWWFQRPPTAFTTSAAQMERGDLGWRSGGPQWRNFTFGKLSTGYLSYHGLIISFPSQWLCGRYPLVMSK
jgi:hypothetical protein